MRRSSNLLSVVIGSLIIAAGSTIAGIMSFQNEPWWVFVGFLIFTVGYWTTQRGTNGGLGIESSMDQTVITRQNILRFVFALVGLGGIAIGVTMFSQTVLDPNVTTATVSGISSIGGYMFAHVGINRFGVGESIFKPLFEKLSRVE